jgi:tetratricopeptide (TPR) repeat protein
VPETPPLELHLQARQAMARRDAGAAKRAIDRLLSAYPTYAPGWLSASVLALDLGDAVRAQQAAEQGLSLTPTEPALLVQRVRCLHARGDLASALRAARDAKAQVTGQPAAQHELGNAFAMLGQYEESCQLLNAALAQNPGDPAVLFNRATVLRFLGQFAAAEADLDKAIAVRPDDWEAYTLRSHLRRQTPARNHVAALRGRLAEGVPPGVAEVQLRFALAKELEDLGAYAESFTALAAGAAARRRLLRYDVADDCATIDHIVAVLNKQWFAAAAPGHTEAAPIFVFGLPRSGTTLVERIIGSHPAVTARGELNDFPAALMQCARAQTGQGALPKHALVDVSATLAPAQLGAAYVARGARLTQPTARATDKLPMNYLYAGLIAAALPAATLVHVQRHPMANGYGMFKTLFNQGYPFSYDLDELGRYMAAQIRLMTHWRTVLGPRLIEVSYEALVRDQNAQTKRLIAACGLDWDEACLAPHESAAPSSTQSAVQVRRPVYADEVDRWRHVAKQLAPLRARLSAEGVPDAQLA